ncbi:MAG TPA: biotin--[acetyl-CoA-carboxylase] ligase [Acidobacteriota bacterium]|nr:biotin--[acetyl-CoA-carboxylase] ligase [Acidobacteriota bacterium]HOT02138.1 biotin--[acetyl-CoA-carboxylase] ligase [Acidobacteriota bacterium]HQF85775.1 biotin--[acetyl-CoA-carboxylase] ligase [Acidobacteriota bacterium]HQG90981.1 biotin--[acetyl-CoA-carboxylase] ligase [Acidobacteriota bacterium]HQK87137.1 biotin--[acetyl-CoA-carboxylase] ligase [Acidobacteriota bacterium]
MNRKPHSPQSSAPAGAESSRAPGSPGGCPYAPMACELEMFRHIHHVRGFGEVDSTNSTARALGEAGDIPPGTLVVANAQRAGRGRLDHTWYSPAGQGIYASLFLAPMVTLAQAHCVTLVTGLSVAQALSLAHPTLARHLDIKWPNDVLWQGRKLGGILVESSLQDNTLRHLVVGIGINVAQTAFPEDIRTRAVSVAQAAGTIVSRHDLLVRVLGCLDANLGRLGDGAWPDLRRQWEESSSFARGRKVKFFERGRPLLGTTCGLMDDGALGVQLRDGERKALYHGEIFEY